jgi:hypothetical protein
MATIPKAKLPKVNKSNRRTKLRPREVLQVAYTWARAVYYSGTRQTVGATFPKGSLPAPVIQQYLDAGLITVAP